MKQQLWWKIVGLSLVCLAFSTAVQAKDRTKALSGSTIFRHAPPTTLPASSVVGEFSGTATHVGTFTGEGVVDGTLVTPYFDPTYGRIVVAQYSGTFSWSKPSGTLEGTFIGLDFLNPDYPVDPTTGNPLVFDTAIQIEFASGSGRFKGAQGSAQAWGIDDPFGATGIFGVQADFDGNLVLP